MGNGKKNRRKYGAGSLQKVNKTWYLRYCVNGKRTRKSLKTGNLKEAEKLAAQIMKSSNADTVADVVSSIAQAKGIIESSQLKELEQQIDRKSNNKIKLIDAWSKFELSPRSNIAPSSHGDLLRFWTRFLNWSIEAYDKEIYMHEITFETALEYEKNLWITGNLKPQTFNRYINLVKRVFRVLAIESGIQINPFQNFSPKKRDIEGKRELSSSEIKAVLEVLENESEQMQCLFAIGMFTGMRLKDACLCEWSSIRLNVKNPHISFKPYKTRSRGKIVQLPIISHLEFHLQKAFSWKEPASDFVIPDIARAYEKRKSLSGKIQKIFIDAGINTQTVNTVGRTICEVGFHSLRHTFVSECAKAGVPLATVQALVGHDNPAMTRHYIHMDIESNSKALQLLSEKQSKVIETTDSLSTIKESLLSMTDDNWRNIRDQIILRL